MIKMTLLYLAATWTVARTITHTSAFSSGSLSTRVAFSRRAASTVSGTGSTGTASRQSWNRYSTTSRLFLSSSSDAVAPPQKVPITLLAGFLGTGKTSTLQHLLQNNEGVRVGVIVNDIASVNIDAKLVSGQSNGVVEMQNGCACCTLADELLDSVDSILGNGKRQLDAVIVELSGVADPLAIKQNWNFAKRAGHPVTSKADIAQVVTLIDASTFGTDWMTWDSAGERDGWVDPADECAAQLNIPELLAEQVEAANVILINKIDLAGPEQVKVASTLARTLNENAIMEEVKYGRVAPQQIFRKLVDVVVEEKPKESSSSHAHDHDHACAEPDCSDPSHSHSDAHAHDNDSAAASCEDPACTDSSHSHSHAPDNSEDCGDPECTDTSHSHSHSHSTSTANLGIVNFVYRATRPFNTKKLLMLLNRWPVPIKDELDLSLLKDAQEEGYDIDGQPAAGSPFVGVLRSKGFCWFAPTRWSGTQEDVWRHATAMYWSHAGKHFGITSAGKWWGTISQDQMKNYFVDNMDEYNRIMKEDYNSEEFGDRRQEIVFIGVNLDEEEITHVLNDCLLTEKGLDRYRQELQNYESSILTSEISGPSLFDVGGTDHMDLN
jgi:G3E family GTPase